MKSQNYAVRLKIDYPESINRLTAFFRLILALPAILLLCLIFTPGFNEYGLDISTALFLGTVIMLVLFKKYPKWWFDFVVELNRFSGRVLIYICCMTDAYPSTTQTQSFHLDIDYPDTQALNRWLPLIKWVLAAPHYIVLIFLTIGAMLAVIVAWFVILITGRFPRVLFDYIEGVIQYSFQVTGYMLFLVTDEYPPFI